MIKHKVFGTRLSMEVSDTANYIAGQVVAVDSNGKIVEAKSGANINFVGLARNNSDIDIKNGSASVYFMQGLFDIYAEDVNDTSTCPFDDTKSFAPGDKLYVDTNSKITNVDPLDGQISFGMVKEVSGTGAGQVITLFLRI